MENKKITYITFKDYDKSSNSQEGFVFFEDGTFIKVSREDLIKYLTIYAHQENISETKELLYNNKHIIHMDNNANEEEICNRLKEESIINDLENKIIHETEDSLDQENPPKNDEDIEDDLDVDNSDIDESLIDKFLKKSKKFKIVVTSLALSTVLAVSMVGCTLIKKIKSKNKDNEDATEALINHSQKKFEKMNYEELLTATGDSTQRLEMTKIGQLLDTFNGKFADKHIEQDKNIKATLTWDEAVALDIAYNDYKNGTIASIFNGSDIDSQTLTNAYKSATSELTAAFILENNEVSISLDNLINDQKGKAFYEKYHELFKKAKNSTGQNQINYVNNFYKELAKDFPIDTNSREIGMQHADSMNEIESYKLSIIPMVAASEMIFQNLEIDNTLSDQATAYFNDLGLCNYVSDKYTQYEAVSLTASTNEFDPYYETFKVKKIDELTEKNQYNIRDNERDLSQLTAFKNIISNHSMINKTEESESTSYSTTTSTKTDSTTNSTSSREEAIKEVGEDKVNEAEQKVNEEINKQNEQTKQEAERKAEEERKKLQQQEDEKKAQLEQEVEKENNDFQDKLDDINKDIDNDKLVNEDDFGKTNNGENIVDIDKDHIDDKGNIDDSIKDITTNPPKNPTKPLPDPSDDGAENGYPDESSSDQNIIESEETISNEELANLIIESMANSNQEETSKTYIK